MGAEVAIVAGMEQCSPASRRSRAAVAARAARRRSWSSTAASTPLRVARRRLLRPRARRRRRPARRRLLVSPSAATTRPTALLDTVGVEPSRRDARSYTLMLAGDGLWAIGDVTGVWPRNLLGKYQAASPPRTSRRSAPRPTSRRPGRVHRPPGRRVAGLLPLDATVPLAECRGPLRTLSGTTRSRVHDLVSDASASPAPTRSPRVRRVAANSDRLDPRANRHCHARRHPAVPTFSEASYPRPSGARGRGPRRRTYAVYTTVPFESDPAAVVGGGPGRNSHVGACLTASPLRGQPRPGRVALRARRAPVTCAVQQHALGLPSVSSSFSSSLVGVQPSMSPA